MFDPLLCTLFGIHQKSMRRAALRAWLDARETPPQPYHDHALVPLSEAASPVGKLRSILMLLVEDLLSAPPLGLAGPMSPSTLNQGTLSIAPSHGKGLEQRMRAQRLPHEGLREPQLGASPTRSQSAPILLAVGAPEAAIHQEKARVESFGALTVAVPLASAPGAKLVEPAAPPVTTRDDAQGDEVPPTPSTAAVLLAAPAAPPPPVEGSMIICSAPPSDYGPDDAKQPATGGRKLHVKSKAFWERKEDTERQRRITAEAGETQLGSQEKCANVSMPTPDLSSAGAGVGARELTSGPPNAEITPPAAPPATASDGGPAAPPATASDDGSLYGSLDAETDAFEPDTTVPLPWTFEPPSQVHNISSPPRVMPLAEMHASVSARDEAFNHAAIDSHDSVDGDASDLTNVLSAPPSQPSAPPPSRTSSRVGIISRVASNVSCTSSASACRTSVCAQCGAGITGHVFMLDDMPFCTTECRLQACRAQARGEGALPTSGSAAHLTRSASALSTSSSSSGLYANFRPWL